MRLDAVSVPMLAVVCLVALAVQVYSIAYMHGETRRSYGRYFTYHALFLFSMNTLVLAPDLLQAFAGWELVGLVSYLLIGFHFDRPSAARAAVKAFWMTKLADMGFLFALLLLYSRTGAFSWDVALRPEVAEAVAALIFIAVMGKSAQFPLHVWLPDAMEGPTPVSALLHAATMVAAGVYLVVRADPLFTQAHWVQGGCSGSGPSPRCSPRCSAWCRPTSSGCWRTPPARSWASWWRRSGRARPSPGTSTSGRTRSSRRCSSSARAA